MMKRIRFKTHKKYVESQRKTTNRKGGVVFFTAAEIVRFADWMKQNGKESPLKGICHGSRAGHEQDEFKKHFPDSEVLGTDLFPYSGKSANNPGKSVVIEWDFSKQKTEWLGSFDFVYTNSLDHARFPWRVIRTWIKQLKVDGVLLVQWTKSNLITFGGGDCFSGTIYEWIELFNKIGNVIDIFYINVPREHGNLLQWKAAESINFIIGKK